jgi:hypothetical protein
MEMAMAKKTQFKIAVEGPPWQASSATYLAGRATLDGVDALAIAMEQKWGVDRLRLLVSAATREKFDRQRFKTNSAIMHGELHEVIEQGSRMLVAWRVLDIEATAAGAEPLSLDTWEVALEDGTVAVIVPTTAQAHLALAQLKGRKAVVFTLEELGHMISVWDGVTRAKLQWPGAEVTHTRRHVADPLDAIPKGTRDLDDSLDGI